MGGNGSGRQGGRPTIERTDCIRLSVHDVMRGFDGVNVLGRWWEWTEVIDGELTAIVRPRGLLAPLVELRYRFDHFSRDTGDQVQYVDLLWTPARFGGRRWWWICPRSGARVTKLYLPNGGIHFRSREAYRLGYQSTRETWRDRAQRRADRLYRKIGWRHGGPIDFWPDKPKGMHWRTYNAICERIDEAEQVVDAGFLMSAERFLARFGGA